MEIFGGLEYILSKENYELMRRNNKITASLGLWSRSVSLSFDKKLTCP